MENINSIWILILVIVVLFVTAMALAVGYFLASSKAKSALLKQQEIVFLDFRQNLTKERNCVKLRA